MTERVQEAFEAIKAEEALKESTKQYLRAERERRGGASRRVPARRWALAACALLALFIGIGGYRAAARPVSYISIDVNPSIELALNRFDRVVSAEAYNRDGAAVLDAVSVRGLSYTQAVDAIVESAAMAPYLGADSALVFTVASGSEEKAETLRAGLEGCAGCKHYGGESCLGGLADMEQAHENGLSLGKYSAYLRLREYDDSLTPERCRDMSMAELRELMEQCAPGSGTPGHGSGHGHGKGMGAFSEG